MSKERYYYRGHWNDFDLFYVIIKVTQADKDKCPQLAYFDTPEECLKYCQEMNRIQLEHEQEKYSIYLRASLEKLKNGENP